MNKTTAFATIITLVLGLVSEDLAANVSVFPSAQQWIIPIVCSVLVAITKHITDTRANSGLLQTP